MNITSQTSALPLATVVNQPTDSLRRENSQREVITQPVPTQHATAEKGVASERESSRTPNQNSQSIDFASLQEKAEREASTISDSDSEPSEQEHQQQNHEHNENAQGGDHEHGDEREGAGDRLNEFHHQQEVRQLKNRDAEVRAHERAHTSVGGSHTGSPSYSFEIGPDGKRYAVAGEVSVDMSPIAGNPEATIAKMQKVRAAALAPASPSIQDTRVAAAAQAIINQAQIEKSQSSEINTDDDERGSEAFSTDGVKYTGEKDVFYTENENSIEISDNAVSNAFDQLMSRTLASQEAIVPSRDEETSKRALRIESFYSTINSAYEQAPKFQFELTA